MPFLRAAMYFMLLAAVSKISGVLEHPAPATWTPAAASSWYLPEVQMLERITGVEIIRIDQCRFGAPSARPTLFVFFGASSVKPTHLLCVHLPEIRRAVDAMPLRGRCNHRMGHRTALGLDENGRYRTAPLKAYPPALCRLIAGAILTEWGRIAERDPDNFVPDDLIQFYQPLDPYIERSRGQDCALFNQRYG